MFLSKQSKQSKQSTPPRPAEPRSTTPRSPPSAMSTKADGPKDIPPQKKDSVTVNKQSSNRKDSLRSSKQRTKVKSIGKPCYLLRSCDNNKLVLDFCSKCSDNWLEVLQGLKRDKGGGMRLNTGAETNFVWMCYHCWEADSCSALDIQRDNLKWLLLIPQVKFSHSIPIVHVCMYEWIVYIYYMGA